MRARIRNGVRTIAVVALVGVSLALVSPGHRQDARDTAKGMPEATAGRIAPARGADALPGGRWSTLPPAPIAGRDPDVAVWTGTAMLVWGGSSPTGDRDYADGASYRPATRAWAMLPRSPLTARTDSAWAWTGRQLVVWGGTDSHDHRLSDGALFNPDTRRWTPLPLAPMATYSSARAVWTGRQVVLITTPPGAHSERIISQAFDPATATWRTLPTLRLRPNHDVVITAAVAGAGHVYVWSEWSHARKTSDGGRELTSGIDGYTLRWRSPSKPNGAEPAAWSANPFTWRGHDLVDGPLWTGREILLPAAQLWCGLCPGPYQFDSSGSRLDPATGSDRVIPHGPADDQDGQYVWTGSVLLAANTQTTTTGGSHNVSPGVTAYWRPSTNRWTRLPQAPMAGAAAVVWTGHSLLVWGSLAPVHQQEPLRTAGLELG